MEEKLKQIISHYGVKNQLKYIHSEYYELTEAILNYENSELLEKLVENKIEHIAEEIADVEMMLDQFKVYYGINQEKINEIKSYKANRQLERIKNGKDK